MQRYELIRIFAENQVERSMDSLERKVGTSETKVGSSGKKVGSSKRKVGTSNQQRLKFGELESLIISIADDYITLDEIAKQINRTFDYIANKIIPRM